MGLFVALVSPSDRSHPGRTSSRNYPKSYYQTPTPAGVGSFVLSQTIFLNHCFGARRFLVVLAVLKLPLKEQGNDEMQSGGQGMLGKDVSFRVSDDYLQLTAGFFSKC